ALGTRTPVEQRGVRRGAPLRGARAYLPEMHETLRVRVWQGLDQGGIGRREDRGGRAQAEAERQDARRREGGPLGAGAERAAWVVHRGSGLGVRDSGPSERSPVRGQST